MVLPQLTPRRPALPPSRLFCGRGRSGGHRSVFGGLPAIPRNGARQSMWRGPWHLERSVPAFGTAACFRLAGAGRRRPAATQEAHAASCAAGGACSRSACPLRGRWTLHVAACVHYTALGVLLRHPLPTRLPPSFVARWCPGRSRCCWMPSRRSTRSTGAAGCWGCGWVTAAEWKASTKASGKTFPCTWHVDADGRGQG